MVLTVASALAAQTGAQFPPTSPARVRAFQAAIASHAWLVRGPYQNSVYVDRRPDGSIVVPSDALRYFSEGLAPVRVLTGQGLCGYTNQAGAFMIPPQYLRAGIFSEGWAPVQLSHTEWAYIDPHGRIQLRVKASFAAPFFEGRAFVRRAAFP